MLAMKQRNLFCRPSVSFYAQVFVSNITGKFVPFEEMDPFVSLENHEPLGSESEKGCGASEILHTQTYTITLIMN